MTRRVGLRTLPTLRFPPFPTLHSVSSWVPRQLLPLPGLPFPWYISSCRQRLDEDRCCSSDYCGGCCSCVWWLHVHDAQKGCRSWSSTDRDEVPSHGAYTSAARCCGDPGRRSSPVGWVQEPV